MFSGKSVLYTPLEAAVSRVVNDLNNHEIGSEEYQKSLDALTKLHKVLEEEKSSVSKDTLVLAGANLVGLMIIISHERLGHIITTRAFSMLLRPR